MGERNLTQGHEDIFTRAFGADDVTVAGEDGALAFDAMTHDDSVFAVEGEEDRTTWIGFGHFHHEWIGGIEHSGAGGGHGGDDALLHFGKLLGCVDIVNA